MIFNDISSVNLYQAYSGLVMIRNDEKYVIWLVQTDSSHTDRLIRLMRWCQTYSYLTDYHFNIIIWTEKLAIWVCREWGKSFSITLGNLPPGQYPNSATVNCKNVIWVTEFWPVLSITYTCFKRKFDNGVNK